MQSRLRKGVASNFNWPGESIADPTATISFWLGINLCQSISSFDHWKRSWNVCDATSTGWRTSFEARIGIITLWCQKNVVWSFWRTLPIKLLPLIKDVTVPQLAYSFSIESEVYKRSFLEDVRFLSRNEFL